MSAALRCCALILYLVHGISSQDYAQLTFSDNPVYSENPVTLTCSHYMSGYSLSQVTVDAFNGSLNKGLLSLNVGTVDTTAAGVFIGTNFVDYLNIMADTTSVSVILTAQPLFELDYSCTLHLTIVSYNSYDYSYSSDSTVLTSNTASLQVRVAPQPPVFKPIPLVFTENGNAATIECESHFGRPAATIYITATSRSGKVASNTDIETALLVLSIPLTDWYEAVVNCSVTNHNLANMFVSSSIFINLLPSPPVFAPSTLVFNETENAAIVCQSRSGRPAAVVRLTVTNSSGTTATTTGIESALLMLPTPVTNWHLATADCTVTNFILTNNVVSSTIFINYIRSIDVPDDVNTTANGTDLDCSIYISSFPGVNYQWSVPPEYYVTNRSLLNKALFSVGRGQTGFFNCTATNVITMMSVPVIFNLSSLPQLSTPMVIVSNSTCELCWNVAVIAVRIAIFAILFTVLFKGVCSSKGESSKQTPAERKSGIISSEPCNVTSASLESVDQQYEFLNTQSISEPTYAQLIKAEPLDVVVEYENIGYISENIQAS